MNWKNIAAASIEIFGDINWRGDCPLEDADTITIINHIKSAHGGRFKHSVLHVKNEKKRKDKKDFLELAEMRKKGSIIAGWSDVTVTGFPTLFIEVKRKDHTQSDMPAHELQFLIDNQNNDCWCCVALGWEAGIAAFETWFKENYIDTQPPF